MPFRQTVPRRIQKQSWIRAETLLDVYVQRGDYSHDHHPRLFHPAPRQLLCGCHCNLGLEYANARQWEKAIRHYRAALVVDPELIAAYNDWGIVGF